jgi:hypothetical protein
MEALIQAVEEHAVLVGDHSHDLVYDLREEEDEARFRCLYSPGEYERKRNVPRPLVDAIAQSPFAAAYIERGENWFLVSRLEGRGSDASIYSLSSGARGQDVDMFGLGRWKELLDVLAPCGISEQGGWCPVPPHAATRGRDGRASLCRHEAALGFSAQRRAPESDPDREREGAGQEKAEKRRKNPVREPS